MRFLRDLAARFRRHCRSRQKRIVSVFNAWLEANVIRCERHLTPLFALYRDYCTWCASRGELPMTGEQFAGAMGCSQGAFVVLGWKPMYVRGALRDA